MTLKKVVVLVAVLGALSSIPALLFTNRAAGAGGAPVIVQNTPLPVQGTVGASQSGNWNVGISGAVNLSPGTAVAVNNSQDVNAKAIPLVVRDADNPAFQPYTDWCTATVSGFVAQCSLQQFPSATLVIEEVDMDVDVPGGQGVHPYYAKVFALSGLPHSFTLTDMGDDGFGTQHFVAHQPTRLYAPQGGALCRVILNSSVVGHVTCAISGYLVSTQ